MTDPRRPAPARIPRAATGGRAVAAPRGGASGTMSPASAAEPSASSPGHAGRRGGRTGGPPAVILAGGEGRRMGGADKGLLRLAGRPLLDHVLARLAPQAGLIALSLNGDPGRLDLRGLPVLPDPEIPGAPSPRDVRAGPLAGVLAGMDWAAGLGAPALVTVAWDTPFLPLDLVARLSAAAEDASAASGRAETRPDAAPRPAVACSPDPAGGREATHPVVALWPVALRHDLRASLAAGERRVGAFLARHGAARARFPLQAGPAGAPPLDPFFNINTPADMAEAERLATAHSA